MLWESDIMIEGEAHCLYKDLSGNVFDITPRVSGEEKILFIEDSRLNVSLKHIKGARFSMIQHTNPQLFFSTNFFVESKAIPFVFDQNEIRVIKLIDYKDSFFISINSNQHHKRLRIFAALSILVARTSLNLCVVVNPSGDHSFRPTHSFYTAPSVINGGGDYENA
ncbi:hypothetical protein LNO89_23670 [Klebsiella pneumoniae subsp. pneumoniae]|nr:hypothetical protein [Klebsiella pneumoniae subsp. pneumoniae]